MKRNRTYLIHHFAAALIPLLVNNAPAQSTGAAKLKTGKEIFEAGCAGCHGGDGRGAPDATVGFEKPETFPDFTRCDQTTPEDDLTWKSVIRDGGPSRGFSQIMPSFSGALTSEQMDSVIHYLRGFCKEAAWPRGELNLPRALGTEKAYPEDEVVITTSLNANGSPGVSNEIVHEQRFGTRNQIEVSVPVDFQRPEPGTLVRRPRRYRARLETGVVFQPGNRVDLERAGRGDPALPGNRSHGLGTGVTTFETFAAYGQLLPWKSFLQFQAGADLPDRHCTRHRTLCSCGPRWARGSIKIWEWAACGRRWWNFSRTGTSRRARKRIGT